MTLAADAWHIGPKHHFGVRSNLPSICRKYWHLMQKIYTRYRKNKFVTVSLSKLDLGQSTTLTRLVGMVPEQSNSTSYRARAAICEWCAEETASAEAAAALLYLEQMYILIAEVTDIIEGNRLRSRLDSGPHHLSRE
jgi:hypothetical protein